MSEGSWQSEARKNASNCACVGSFRGDIWGFGPSSTKNVGVSLDDWFKYGATFEWSSEDPNATHPLGYEWWQLWEEVEWWMITVEQVSGTNVTLQTVAHFVNETEIAGSGYIDIDTGAGENFTLWFVSADLDVDDTLYTSGDYSDWMINETIIRTYPDSTRETNHINMTMDYSWEEQYYHISMNYYWDRGTGVLAEMSFDWENQTLEYLTTWSVSIGITESNVWVIPEFPMWALIPVFIGLTSVLIICKRRIFKTIIQ